ncbi:hypothetical protein ACGFIY_21215 [Micromonospora chersina]|uniref:hypothetical protein n=1 Tax=Micromonospora chersina TaxID=47854 RepID=UPI003716DB01
MTDPVFGALDAAGDPLTVVPSSDFLTIRLPEVRAAVVLRARRRRRLLGLVVGRRR